MMACIRRLGTARIEDRILLDRAGLVVSEYRSYASLSGGPGPGDLFMKWLWDNRANPVRCLEIELSALAGDPEDFEEFPTSLRTAGFDRDDRKFVALALACNPNAPILNAVDTDYADAYPLLQSEGVDVEFLCDHVQPPA